MSAMCTTPSTQHLQNWSAEKCRNGSQKSQKNSINSNTVNRCMHPNGINSNVEESKDLILYNSQALPFPVIPQLWYTPRPFIPYYFTSPPPQYPSLIPYLSYYSNATPAVRKQKHQVKKVRKPSKTHFWCAGIGQLLWTIVVIIALGLLAMLILALLVI